MNRVESVRVERYSDKSGVDFHHPSGYGFLARNEDLMIVGDGDLEKGIDRVRARYARLTPAQLAWVEPGMDMHWIYDMVD